jgi:mono/diheme cytochrome c family protein
MPSTDGGVRRWRGQVVAIGAAVGLAFLFALGDLLASGPTRADPNDVKQVALGQAVYAQHCASCHGVNLEGQPDWRTRKPDGRLPAPPHDADGHTWHHPDEHLFGMTKNGMRAYAPPGYESDMQAFGDILSDAEIWAVLAFIKSRWPAEIRARQERLNRQPRR